MRTILKKIGVLFALLLTLTASSVADINKSVPQLKLIDSKFILEGNKNIDPRAIEKIDRMGSELFVKTGVSVYIYATDRYANKMHSDMKSKMEFIKSFETNITKTLKEPFVLLSVSVEDTHINIRYSDELASAIDRDNILDNNIIPVLASKDKNSVYAKMSAAILNGYAAITDSVADSKGLELESSIGSGGTIFSSIWRVFMYFIILSGLSVYIYAYFRSRRR
ncbi:hypothetical protein GSY74_07350 [Sulfurovum sp. bin170]|uniref:hypothetical protein n=1 Tax=Sulfurovum sp. bin170 TaxID=2695268 RepID=UPI0013E0C24C|nr:hypothetical protein [Sulfurovum sp. bin170]NEW61095.1 hypothetical protein [Sulfurovum sp. bin170]